MDKQQKNKNEKIPAGDNKDLEGNDKAPGEEQGKGEKVTLEDLKGKKIDADLSKEEDKPLER